MMNEPEPIVAVRGTPMIGRPVLVVGGASSSSSSAFTSSYSSSLYLSLAIAYGQLLCARRHKFFNNKAIFLPLSSHRHFALHTFPTMHTTDTSVCVCFHMCTHTHNMARIILGNSYVARWCIVTSTLPADWTLL